LEQKATGGIYYRKMVLSYRYDSYPYFYIAPPECDCFDYSNSEYANDPGVPGGIRISGGFCLRLRLVGKLDIFRVKGMSSRKIIISEGLKEIFEACEVRGVKYIQTEDYRDR